ncbi:MAG TPA: hypothetical protein ENI87_07950 [bacterium]|nr:hypothetical protein [bacterium]
MIDPHPHSSEPTDAQITATIAVLGDDRGPLQETARRSLLRWGARAVPLLREHADCARVQVRIRCRQLLRAIELRQLVGRFARLQLDRSGRSSVPGLLEGAVLAAQIVRTFVPEARQLAARLRREANALRRDCTGRSVPMCARLLAERMHDRLGLARCDAERLDAEHVLIDRVLQNGVGAPVSLSLIYLLVARWAGLSAAGVAMPDHFLVRLHGPRPLLLDPFHGGRVVTKVDCARYLRANGHDRVREHLRDLSDCEVLIHYLRALRKTSARRPTNDAQVTLGRALELLEPR